MEFFDAEQAVEAQKRNDGRLFNGSNLKVVAIPNEGYENYFKKLKA